MTAASLGAPGPEANGSAYVVELHRIRRWYAGAAKATVAAIRDVSMKVRAGEFVSIVGRSGSGKTTLLHIMGTLDRPTSGTVRLLGKEVTNLVDDDIAAVRAWSIGFVFQSFCLIDNLTAAENVATGLIYRGLPRELRVELAFAALERLGLRNRVDHLPAELSGGERQRVAIARAIVGDRVLILADEPTGNLDSVTAGDIWTVLRHIARQGVAVVAATHDATVATVADRQVRLHDGSIEGTRD